MVFAPLYNAFYKVFGANPKDKDSIYRYEETLELPAVPMDLWKHYSSMGMMGTRKVQDIRYSDDKTNSAGCITSFAIMLECYKRYSTTHKGQKITITKDKEVAPLSVEEIEAADQETIDMMMLTAKKKHQCNKYHALAFSHCAFHEFKFHLEEFNRGTFAGIQSFTTRKPGDFATMVTVNENREIVAILNAQADSHYKVGDHVH